MIACIFPDLPHDQIAQKALKKVKQDQEIREFHEWKTEGSDWVYPVLRTDPSEFSQKDWVGSEDGVALKIPD